MKKFFTKFNVICLFLDFLFLIGTIFIFIKNSQPKIEVDNIIEPISHEYFEDNNITTTEEAVNEGVIKEIEEESPPVEINDESTLPKEFLLDVPFTSQAPEKNWDQPWQDACEEAALLMLDAYYKEYNLSSLFARDEILKMVAWEEKRDWGYDIDASQFQIMANEYFKINLKIVDNPTVDDIKKIIVSGKPILGIFDGKVLPNPHFRNGGPIYHALIIKGYDETNFITNDPGTQFGESFKYKYDDLLNAIHDWNGGDVSNGRKVILVVE